MKIVADENIPLIEHYFQAANEIVLKSGREIERADLLDADVLLVRSVTSVNEKLLKGTSVKFVGSATTGFDHLDIAYLNEHAIDWSIAKGCNAIAVVEYVISILAMLAKMNYFPDRTPKAAVIGVGLIGSQVSQVLKVLGFKVVHCDPFRAEKESSFVSTELADLVDVDLITLHTPLTKTGKYPTFHMIEKTFLQRQKANCLLINTSRGSVIHFEELKQYGTHLRWCLDVWENEPLIDLDILTQAWIATPHIAGYSLQSKFRGIDMLYRYALSKKIIPDYLITTQYPRKSTLLNDSASQRWFDIFLTVLNPHTLTLKMKKSLAVSPDAFDALRKQEAGRYESQFIQFENCQLAPGDGNIFVELKNVLSS